MLEIETVRERLETVFCTVFNLDSINLTDGMTAADVKKWDSLSNIRLMISIEKAFGIRFTGAEFERLRNVGDLIRSVQSKAAGP